MRSRAWRSARRQAPGVDEAVGLVDLRAGVGASGDGELVEAIDHGGRMAGRAEGVKRLVAELFAGGVRLRLTGLP